MQASKINLARRAEKNRLKGLKELNWHERDVRPPDVRPPVRRRRVSGVLEVILAFHIMLLALLCGVLC